MRETWEKAWDAADDLIAQLDDKTIERAFSGLDSVGQKRIMALHSEEEGHSRSGLTSGPGSGWCAAA